MMTPVENNLSYILNHLHEDRQSYAGATSPPIMQTAKHAFESVAEMRNAMINESDSFVYGRGHNPTTAILEKKLAALDGAEAALVVNSGSTAISAAVMAHIHQGEHIISINKPYYWATALFDNVIKELNVETTYVDGTDITNIASAIRPNTKIIYLESPNSWTYELQDLDAVGQLARRHGILTIIDNTYCTPLYQRPLDFGIDISLQSASKYIGGHGDVIAGVICAKKELIEPIIGGPFMTFGLQTSPFHSWLLLRGLRTLPVRLERISITTKKIVEYLKAHPAVEEIIFPFDPDFPQYALAKKQMKDAFGLITIVLKNKSRQSIESFCNHLEYFTMAVSWGGYESQVMPGCVTVPDGSFDGNNRGHRLIRLAIGLEDAGVLIDDLGKALEISR